MKTLSHLRLIRKQLVLRGKKHKAKVMGADRKTDLAVLKLQGGGPYPAANLGDSDRVKVGDWVLAIGGGAGSLIFDAKDIASDALARPTFVYGGGADFDLGALQQRGEKVGARQQGCHAGEIQNACGEVSFARCSAACSQRWYIWRISIFGALSPTGSNIVLA